jgi:hypothetical protein
MLATRASHKAASLTRVGTSIRHSNRPLLASSFPSTASSLPAHHTPHEERHHTHPYRHGAGWIRRHYFSSSSFLDASRPTLYTMGEVRLPLSLPSPALLRGYLNQTTSLLLRRTNVAALLTINLPFPLSPHQVAPFPTQSLPLPVHSLLPSSPQSNRATWAPWATATSSPSPPSRPSPPWRPSRSKTLPRDGRTRPSSPPADNSSSLVAPTTCARPSPSDTCGRPSPSSSGSTRP